MTTKVNKFARNGFGLQPQQIPDMKPNRIIIEFIPGSLTGDSMLKVEGNLTQVGVALALSAHLHQLLPTMIKGLFQAAKGAVLIDPKTGQPAVPDTLEIQTEEQPEEPVQG